MVDGSDERECYGSEAARVTFSGTNPSTILAGVLRAPASVLVVEPVVQPVADAAERPVVESSKRQEVIESQEGQRPRHCLDDALLQPTFTDEQDVDGDHRVCQHHQRQCDQTDAQLHREQDDTTDAFVERQPGLPRITMPHGNSPSLSLT